MNAHIKILLIDIETKPMIAYVWNMHKPFVSLDHVVEWGGTICWAAKWLGKDTVTFRSVHHHGHEKMVEDAYKLLDQADAVVTYNGDKFDLPKLNQEFMLSGMPPVTPYRSIDLYRVVRKEFRFDSNKLDHVSRQLGLGAKIQHRGMELWKGCMEGDHQCWKEMKEYNIQDTHLLDGLYLTLLPRIKKNPNMALYLPHDGAMVCPTCGSENLREDKNRTYKTGVNEFPQFKCVDCGTNARGRYAIVDPHKGNVLVRVEERT